MTKMGAKKLIRMDEERDLKAIAILRERYGCESDSAAVRLALRVLAASPMLEIAKGKPTYER